MLFCIFTACFSADINIWLVTFGFHLHNAIPGFPIPKFDLTEPSLEMKKSQLWDDLPVCILIYFYYTFLDNLDASYPLIATMHVLVIVISSYHGMYNTVKLLS